MDMQKNTMKRLFLLITGIFITASGTAISIKAELGQGALNAFAANTEIIWSIKAGTTITIINFLCFFLQVLLIKRALKPIQILQIPLAVLFGAVVNILTYDLPVISEISPNTYVVKIILLLLSLILSTFGVALMLKANLILLPFEGFCNALVAKFNTTFAKVRPFVEGAFMFLSILIIIGFNLENTTVREGTVLYTIFFGILTDFFRDRCVSTEIK